MLEEKHKPCDASVKITLTTELRAIPFKMASNYYNDVVSVLTCYDLSVSETDLIQFLVERVKTDTLAKIVIDHLKQTSSKHNLESL